MADIATRAKIAHGSFYTYFDSKDDVFRSLAEEVHTEMREAIAGAERSGPMRERLTFAIERYVDAYERNAQILGVIEQVATFDQHFSDLRADLRHSFVAMLERAVARAYKDGEATGPKLDAKHTASALGVMIESFSYTWFVLGEPYDRKRAMATLNAVCARTLGL